MAEQPDWLKLPLDLLEPIGRRTRDAVMGVAIFRSVCRAWRAAVRPTPRLLLPAAQDSAAPRGGSVYALVYPLSRGWSIVVDTRDVSCHLKHLPTAATAALPNLNAVRDSSATSEITHLGYEHAPDREEPKLSAVHDGSAASEVTYLGYEQAPDHEEPNLNAVHDGSAPSEVTHLGDEHAPDHEEAPTDMGDDCLRPVTLFLNTHLELSHYFTFAVHVPPSTPAASADGMVIMAYHLLRGHTGMVFCRPGDAAWTKVASPNSQYVAFADFAYSESEGKTLALDNKGVTVVFDAATLEVLYQVDLPPATSNFRYKHSGRDAPDESSCLRLVAVPGKVLLVKICIKSSRPEGFLLFELSSGSEKGDGGPVWRKHATFGDDRDGGGTRIYYFHDEYKIISRSACTCHLRTTVAYIQLGQVGLSPAKLVFCCAKKRSFEATS
ncbi:hypothetical protein VPH35_014774 [Triticum aestivum]